MAGNNQRKVAVLIGTAMGAVMAIYWKTLQAVKKDLVPGSKQTSGADTQENETEAQKPD